MLDYQMDESIDADVPPEPEPEMTNHEWLEVLAVLEEMSQAEPLAEIV